MTDVVTCLLTALGILLVLRAFSSGAAALTGVEAISDGVPAFKPPEWQNARTTLTVMIVTDWFIGGYHPVMMAVVYGALVLPVLARGPLRR